MRIVSERFARKTPAVIHLKSPTGPSGKFHWRISGGSRIAAPSVACFGVALVEEAEAPLLVWIPAESRLWAVKPRDSFKVRSRGSYRCSLLVVSACAPAD